MYFLIIITIYGHGGQVFLLSSRYNRLFYEKTFYTDLHSFMSDVLNYGLHARTVEGVVTCGGKKLSNVIVTDGFKFTKTEKNGVKPMFPFGFGLSYTTFEYSDLNIVKDGAEFVASFNVKNTGKVAGAEVAQVYVTDNECSVVRPEKELKGFEKVFLNPGETKTLSVRLGEEAFRFYSLGKHDFVVEPGVFTVSVGSSSADIRLTGTLSL